MTSPLSLFAIARTGNSIRAIPLKELCTANPPIVDFVYAKDAGSVYYSHFAAHYGSPRAFSPIQDTLSETLNSTENGGMKGNLQWVAREFQSRANNNGMRYDILSSEMKMISPSARIPQ